MGIYLAGYDWPLGRTKQVAYVDFFGHLQELFVGQGGSWQVADLTNLTGAPVPSATNPIVGFAWSEGATKQVIYVHPNGHLQELFVGQGGGWQIADLTNLTGAPVADSGNIDAYDWPQAGGGNLAKISLTNTFRNA